MHTGRVSVSAVADYAGNIPRGGAIGQAMGGAMAITAEEDALWSVEHAIVMAAWATNGRSGKQPKRREYPEGTVAEEQRRQKVIAQARAHKEKMRRRHSET
jgi:hypothetical protein